MLEHTIYKNPVGWAERLAGTRRRYLLSSFLTILAGSFLMYFSVSTSRERWFTAVASVTVVIFTVELPLYYLRAMRALLKERGS